jgi:SPP1 gp7 family putative phage head morphogenesis protein
LSALDDTADLFRAQLEQREEHAARQVVAAYQQALAVIVGQRSDLLKRLAAARAAGPITPRWLYEQQRMAALSKVIRAEIFAYTGTASRLVVTAQDEALAVGRVHGQRWGESLDARMRPGPLGVLQSLLGHLADGSPVQAALQGLPDGVEQQTRTVLVAGIAANRPQQWIVDEMDKALDVPRWRAETLARTEYWRAYRASQQQVFLANPDAVAGWVWRAKRDAATCIACIAMDGTEHKVEDLLREHPRGRCQMVPIPQGRRPRQRATGEDWLRRQRPDVQRAIMGPGKWEAWQAGTVRVSDMAVMHDDPLWGLTVREPSLRELVGDLP